MNEIDKYLNSSINGGNNPIIPQEPIPVEPSTVAKVGDFVNYSVTLDSDGDGVAETYDKWRILYFDNNEHMEIVCYKGPNFRLGDDNDYEKSKSEYANAIKILNDASQPYKNGKYGFGARHLGTDPTNPSSYETISEEYVRVYGDSERDSSTYKPTTNLEYLEQTHHETDINAINSFSGSKKLFYNVWLGSRLVYTYSSNSAFCVRRVHGEGDLNYCNLYNEYSDGSKKLGTLSDALAPVVILESEIKIDKNGNGNGSEEKPWILIK